MATAEKTEVSSYREALDATVGMLCERKINLKEKHYVFVPDRYTLFAEREIFSRLGGAFDVEVLTFNRLFSKYFRGRSYLPRHGAVMLLKRIIDLSRKEFKCFSRSAEFKGFAEKLYDAIKLLSACRISPSELEFDGALKTKIEDVRLIYSKYLEHTADKHIDAAGRMELLSREIATKDFSDVSLYFPMHGEFTRQEKEIVDIMCRTARRCEVYSVIGAPKKFGNTEFYICPDIAGQLKAAAKRIIAERKRGTRYDEMCIIAPAEALGQTERILSEFGIPFYIDKKLELGSQALPRYIEKLFEATENGYAADDFIALSKNFYSGVDKEDSDAFENYCVKYRVEYKGFLEPFVRGADEEREAPERVRAALAEQVGNFELGMRGLKTAGDFHGFIKKYAESGDAAERTIKLSAAADVDLSSVPEKTVAVAALMYEVFGDAEVSPRTMFEMFFEGLSAGRISLLPPNAGAVEVGDSSAFIAAKFVCAFVIGLAEGVLPPIASDCAVITDTDMDLLRGAGITLEPKVSDINAAAESDFLHSVAGAEKLFVGCAEPTDRNLFPSLAALLSGAEKIAENSPEKELSRLNAAVCGEKYFALAARHLACVGNALETYLLSEARIRAGGRGLPFHRELKNALLSAGAGLVERTAADEYGMKNRHDIFFYKNSTTISRVQDYFICPYRNFLGNAVRLREREDGRLQPMDVGTFLHRAAELFVSYGEFDDPEPSAERAVAATLEENEKYVLDANKPFIERLCAESKQMARIIAAQIRGGNFENLGCEMRFGFGEKSDLKTVGTSAGGRTIALRGIIDRVDVFRKYGTEFARVIDYKTGSLTKTNFDFSELYYGRKIQLMLYMKILEENGYRPAGMFYFPFSVAWNDDEFSHRLIGVYNNDFDITVAFDGALKTEGAKSTIINAHRKVKGEQFRSNNSAFGENELSCFADYAFKVLSGAAEEIVSGFTMRSPAEGACRYCEYKGVCRPDGSAAERIQPKASAETVLAAMGMEACGDE